MALRMMDLGKSARFGIGLGAAVAAVAVTAGCSSSASNDAGSSASSSSAASAVAEPSAPAAAAPVAATAGGYIDLDAYEADKASLAGNNVVLFFNASWCPTCREANSNFEASKASFPNGLTIVNVDYDSNTDLRKQYGVTTQHTFVAVDPDGEQLKKWTGSDTIAQVEVRV